MSAADPLVSVIVCTRNRARDLALALASLTEQVPDTPAFETIVVDNASTDDTRPVAERFADRLTLRCIGEPVLGLCHARNAGWRAARGRFVAYLDDDALACRGWVRAVANAFALMPEAGAVGGRVDPVWHAPRPAWLSDRAALGLTIVDWSETPKVLADLGAEWLVGANMAVRADVLRQVGGFRPELDRVGTRMLSSGDVFLLKEVTRLGHPCLYYPAMQVQHAVAASRLSQRWFRSRYYWQGVSDAVMQLLEQRPSTATRARLAARALGRLAVRPGRVSMLWPSEDPARFEQACWLLIELGHAAGLCGLARVGQAAPPTMPA